MHDFRLSPQSSSLALQLCTASHSKLLPSWLGWVCRLRSSVNFPVFWTFSRKWRSYVRWLQPFEPSSRGLPPCDSTKRPNLRLEWSNGSQFCLQRLSSACLFHLRGYSNHPSKQGCVTYVQVCRNWFGIGSCSTRRNDPIHVVHKLAERPLLRVFEFFVRMR